MQSTIVITAPPKTGNLFRISVGIRKLGYKINDSRTEKSHDGLIEKFFVTCKSTAPVKQDALARLREYAPFIVDIALEGASNPQSEAQAAAPKRLNAHANISQVESEQAEAAKRTIADLIESESKKLIDAYPRINDVLVNLEATHAGEQNAQVMRGIGSNLGTFAAQKQTAKPKKKRGFFDRTVQQSLSMNQPQFGGLPVIDDLVSMSSVKKKKQTPSKELEIVMQELAKFLTVSADGSTLVVTDCPHCSAQHTSADKECDFVLGFLQTFVMGLQNNNAPTVRQITSQAAGEDACRFTI